MFIFRTSLILIIMLLCTIPVMAQGEYLKKGEKGIEIGLFTPLPESEQKMGGRAGFSTGWMVDFDLSFQKIGIRKTLYTKSLAFYIIRDNNGIIPFGLKLKVNTASYSLGSLFSENIYSYGPVLYRNIPLSDRFAFIPSLGFSLLRDNSLDRDSHRQNGTSLDLALSAYLRVYKGNTLKVSLGYSKYDSDWVGEAKEKDELEVQATYIVRNFGGKRVGLKERRELYAKGNKSSELGFNLLFMAADEVTMGGLSLGIREPQMAECNLSGVFYSGHAFGLSGDFAIYAIKGGTEYGGPGLCLLGGFSSVEGYGSFSIGAGIYGDCIVSTKTMIQPMLAVVYTDGPGPDAVGAQFSLSIYNEIKKGRKIKFEIAIVMVDVGSGRNHYNKIGLGLGIGLMFGGTSDNHKN